MRMSLMRMHLEMKSETRRASEVEKTVKFEICTESKQNGAFMMNKVSMEPVPLSTNEKKKWPRMSRRSANVCLRGRVALFGPRSGSLSDSVCSSPREKYTYLNIRDII